MDFRVHAGPQSLARRSARVFVEMCMCVCVCVMQDLIR